MESLGYIFGIAALLWCISLSGQVDKLKRTLKEYGMVNSDYTSLREILKKNIGKRIKIEFESDAMDYEILAKHCLLEDIDDDWILVKIDKCDTEKLLRVESIKSIQII